MFVLIKFPSRGRPDKLKSTLQKYVDNAANMNLIFIMITLDSDDTTVDHSLINSLLAVHPNIRVDVGISGTKVKAINRDMEKAPQFDILLLASDDMIPIVWGYDNIIRHAMHKHYPNTDGVVWFNDGHQRDGLNTLSIMGYKYYLRFGYIYNPIYKTAWCDNEFTEVSRLLNKQIYFNQVIIEHQHPIHGLAAMDDTYRKNDTGGDADTETYKQRKSILFGVSTGLKLPIIKVKIYK
jgi:hypothetical protein